MPLEHMLLPMKQDMMMHWKLWTSEFFPFLADELLIFSCYYQYCSFSSTLSPLPSLWPHIFPICFSFSQKQFLQGFIFFSDWDIFHLRALCKLMCINVLPWSISVPFQCSPSNEAHLSFKRAGTCSPWKCPQRQVVCFEGIHSSQSGMEARFHLCNQARGIFHSRWVRAMGPLVVCGLTSVSIKQVELILTIVERNFSFFQEIHAG